MWIFFAVLNPIIDASRNVFSKKASKNIDSILVSWINNFIPLLFFIPIIFFIEIDLNYEFVQAIVISGLINIAAVVLYHRAISKGDLSLVVPMLSFTPLFLLLLSPVILGEYPSLQGIIGIILIVGGSYLLNINLKEKNIFAPVKSLFRNKGTRYMFIVSFIWSISANFDKRAIESSSIWQYLIFINIFINAGITIIAVKRRELKYEALKKEWKNLTLMGLLTGAGFIVYVYSISLAMVPYIIAIKRTSGMISTFFGYLFFNEMNIRQRLLGSFIMLGGVLLIIL